ncbi:Na+/H+ antiporter NhaA [Demequina sp. TTPB684]|uniref:Na+/H+ antiporter NhaA n=1 Tax=unclassified Demequina TaxID=2620311 RepID=UPI001CF1D590|nr:MULTISPECIES: Na+/H+ antiporter NhaA [unclassified Demequina]MCB2413218.1 Na+/H+ antiporter NhaA [Demequina sp. TTPB684]UPU88207.1 Na+/H+ antiporter NhaA [Demequina sp. TMPB413]
MARTRAGRLFSRLTPSTEETLADVLRTERAGGVLLLVGTVVALVWANSAWAGAYETVKGTVIGPHALYLDLALETWAKDGLLAIFFFVIGLELKREIVAGELRKPSTAIVPIIAAVGGMLVPAGLYVLINAFGDGGSLSGWAVPVATDIAFAVAVLSIVGRWLPNALRAFLLTLAVVDDLLAIIIIAVFFSDSLAFAWLGASALCIVLFWYLIRRGITSAWILVPLALVAWGTMHASGVHATIAGVALGLAVPAIARKGKDDSLAEHWEHWWRPISAGVAVPVFALFAAGVVIDSEAISVAASDPVAQGVVAGLVLGKPLGILLFTFIVATFTRASLDRGLSWWDVLGMSSLAGIGFTVSLLIGDLAFAGERVSEVKMSVLAASLLSALLGSAILLWRDRHYRAIFERRSTPVPDSPHAKEEAHKRRVEEDRAAEAH